MPLLYKYLSPDRGPSGEYLLSASLRTMTLLASNPLSFNDPFEVRPYFDQECHDHFAKSYETFYETWIQAFSIGGPFNGRNSD